MKIPLEDTFADVIGKAQRGLGLSAEELASKAQVTESALAAVMGGKFDAATVRALAPVLDLGSCALVALGEGSYHPAPIELPGLAVFNTPFSDIMVNSFLVWDENSRQAVAFDTGADATPMLDFLRDQSLTLEAILLTHTHGDHVLELDRLKEKTGAPAFVGDREPGLAGAEAFACGRAFDVDTLHIDTRLTWGHAQGGISYVISGLSCPLAVVGDAVFAGSMGGGMVSYADALRTNRKEILTLPEETILACGHGPLTTVAEQKQSNPFFASSANKPRGEDLADSDSAGKGTSAKGAQ